MRYPCRTKGSELRRWRRKIEAREENIMRNALEAILRKAGEEIIMPAHFHVEQKGGHANFVTDMDKHLQDELMEALYGLCPSAEFFCEEKENQPLTDRPTWVIDPIDGTTNFIHGYGMSAISCALLENREPVLGCVYHPYLRETYSAEKGKGAFLNNRPMRVSENPMERALVGFGTSPYQTELGEASLNAALAFLRRCADIRRGGSAALDLAYVACGRQDIFFELNLQPWDVAAGSLLVREAGGIFTMPLQTETDYNIHTTMFASNALCAEEALDVLKKTMAAYGITQQLLDSVTR